MVLFSFVLTHTLRGTYQSLEIKLTTTTTTTANDKDAATNNRHGMTKDSNNDNINDKDAEENEDKNDDNFRQRRLLLSWLPFVPLFLLLPRFLFLLCFFSFSS